DEGLDAEHHALLVGDDAEADPAGQVGRDGPDGLDGGDRGGDAGLHVGAAAAVQHAGVGRAVGPGVDATLEGGHPPSGRVALGDDVGVALEHQGPVVVRVEARAGEVADHVRPAGGGLLDDRLEAGGPQLRGDEL